MSITKEKIDLMGPIAWMAKNPVAANLMMLFFLLGGIAVFFVITQEFFPNIIQDTVTVSVPYPGASPDEVEEGVVFSIEEAMRGIDGVKEIRSTAGEGRGSVTAELFENGNTMKVYQDIKSEIDRITTFPKDAEDPIVTLNSRRREVISLAVYGNMKDTSLRELVERIRNRLLEDPQITQIELEGIRNLEISVEVSLNTLRKYKLTLPEIANKLKAASIDLPAGGIKTRGGEILVRITERRNVGMDFANIPIITTSDGSRVTLGDIAEIKDGFEDSDRYAIYNGKPAIMLAIYRVGEQTPSSVANAVKRQIAVIEPQLPEGVGVAVLRDMASIYEQRMALLTKNGLMGLVLVLILLGLFLELRLALWVMMGIPISFLGALMLMPLIGLSLNMVTMFAFIVALGIVVDDAIVVGENIYHHHQQGMPFIDSAILGAREVAVPVSFSIMTNIVAFIPLCLLPGRMGKILWMLPAVVIIAFSISWLESLFILPAHLGHYKEKKRKGFRLWLHTKQQKFSKWFMLKVNTWYKPFLELCLGHRYLVIVIAISIFVLVIGYAASGRMGYQLFPKVESNFAFCYAQLPYGTPVKKSEEITRIILKAAEDLVKETGRPELSKGIFADIGKKGSHSTEIRVFLADAEIRNEIKLGDEEMNTQNFVKHWRERTGNIPGVENIKFQADRGGPGGGSALSLELKHENMKILDKASAEIAYALKEVPLVSDIDDGFQRGKRQLDFKIKPEGESLGITSEYIARGLRGAYEGTEAARQQRGRNEIKVKVRLPASERLSEFDLNQMIIRAPGGVEVPLEEVIEVKRGYAFTAIKRRNGHRTIELTADVRPRAKTGEVIKLLNEEIMPGIIEKYPELTYSFEGKQADNRESVNSLFILIPLVLLVIYGMLAIPFRSYIQPVIVMVSIPFGIIGAVIGHIIMGYSMSLIGIIGILALSGVVVNDSLILIDFANKQRKKGSTPREAIIAAGVQRFRPILLTTLTTFGGLMPIIFETSRQARFLIPIAISLGYGILFATTISLILIPTLYLSVEDAKKSGKWLFKK